MERNKHKLFALTRGQQALWALDRFETNPANYVISAAATIRPRLDKARLEKVFNEILRRHEALRTRFQVHEQGPLQYVRETASLEIPFTDACHLGESQLRERLRQESSRPFDLEQDLPLRLHVFQREHDSVLLFCVHHIVADFWSLASITETFPRLYAELGSGSFLSSGPSGLGYREFCERSNNGLETDAAVRAAKYWKSYLAGPLPVLALPASPSRTPPYRRHGSSLRFQLPTTLSVAVARMANDIGVTKFSVLLAAYFRLLHDLTGQDDIIVGVPFLGRSRADEKALTAYCVNPLPVRTTGVAGKAFSSLCQKTGKDIRAALARQKYPFFEIVKQLGIARDALVTPVFQTMFAFQKSQSRDQRWLAALAVEDDAIEHTIAGMTLRAFPFSASAAQFDLALTMAEVDGRLCGTIQYDADAFSSDDVSLIAELFEETLQRETASGKVPVSARDTVEEEGAGFSRQLLAGMKLNVERTAMRADNREWTYEALLARTSAWRHALLKSGMKAGDVAAVVLPQGFELIAASCAVLLAGAVLAPMDSRMPAARREHYLARCAARFLVCERKDNVAPAAGLSAVDIATVNTFAQPGGALAASDSGQGGACVFTSGSSGVPRCVRLGSGNLAFLVDSAVREYSLTASDRVMQFTSPGFDVFLEEVLPALSVGAQLIPKPPELTTDIADFEGFLKQNRVSVLNIPTAFWRAWVSQMHAAPEPALPDLRLVIVGGEVMQPEILAVWRQRMPKHVRILNAYGPSEVTVTATLADVTHAAISEDVPIGGPLKGVEARVLDEHGNEVADGEAGELYLTGAAVGHGYIGDVLSTRRRFDLRGPNGQRGFRTGDRVIRKADGMLHYLGRIDRQLKVQGVRIEPEEVEQRVRQFTGASRAIALMVKERLVAFMETDDPVDHVRLRYELAHTLLPQMIPAEFVQLRSFPCGAGGKPDIDAIKAHYLEEHATSTPVAAKGSAEHEKFRAHVLSVLHELHGISFDPSANLFEQGMDSLGAVALATGLSTRCALDVPVRCVFENPSVDLLAAAMAGLRQRSPVDASPKRYVPDAPLTPSQRRLMHFRSMPVGVNNDYRLIFEFAGELHAERFEATWRRVLERHDVFSLAISEQGMSALPDASCFRDVMFSRVEMPSETGAEQDVEALLQRHLDVSILPFLKSVLLKISGQRWVFAIAASPLVVDAESLSILLRQLESSYNENAGKAAGAMSSYLDFAHRVATLPDAAEYWQRRLEHCTTAPRLAIRRENARPMLETGTVRRTLEGPLAEQLMRLASTCQASPASVFLLAWQLLIRRYCNYSGRIGIGAAVSQRGQFGSHGLVGTLTNFTILCPDIGLHESLENALRKAQNEILDAMAHQHVDMKVLLGSIARPGELLPVECLFLYQPSPPGDFALAGLETRVRPFSTMPMPALLSLEVTKDGDAFLLEVRYDKGVYESRRIEALCDALMQVFKGMRKGSATPLAAMDTLPARLSNCREGPLADWSDRPELLHVTFSLTARKHPLRTALVVNGHAFSYGFLYRASNRIARAIFRQVRERRKKGENLLVGILMDKSWEQVAAALGVLRGGGVFAPIDPALPETRVMELIEKAGIDVVLTTPLYRKLYAWPDGFSVFSPDDPEIRKQSLIPLRKRTVGISPTDPAYVMFTSGTTGDPKGVVISHAAVLNTVYDINRRLQIRSDDVFFGLSNFHFDLSVYDMFGAFVAGARLVLPDHERRLDTAHWETLLREQGVTVWNSVPALYGLLLDRLHPPLPDLRHVLLSGDWIPLELPKKSRAVMPEATVYSLGGATEVSIWSVFHVTENIADDARSVPYGMPLANQGCRVLDENGNECPPDVPGELYIGGAGVAAGYHRNPAATRHAFVEHGTQRYYRTGDAARLNSDGWLEILGRLDDRVKIRGRFVDVSLVERETEAHDQVRRAAVVATTNRRGHVQLTAFLVRAGNNLDVSGLKQWLAERLPSYMVPARFALLEQLPLTGNGKVDRKALQVYHGDFIELGGRHEPPRNEHERMLIALWQELLNIENIGIDDNFFELGGDSLLVIAMAAGLQRQFGVEVPVQALVQYQTVRELAAALKALLSESAGDPAMTASAGFEGIATDVLLAEAELDASVVPNPGRPRASSPRRRRVLLTGATGYLGSRILAELLASTDDDIFCLIRGNAPGERLRGILQDVATLSRQDEARLTVLPGDLGKPLLGLAEAEHRLLAQNLDGIIHCGARVNFMLPRTALRAENVGGTSEILKLAVRGRPKSLSHISTVSVFPTIAVESEQVFREDDSIDHGQAIVGGYSQSKWISERLVHAARERGISATIFRPGVIFGDIRHGDLPGDVLLVDFLKLCIRMGSIPDLDLMVDVAPVDFVAAAIVALHGSDANGNFNLTNPHPVHLREFVATLNKAGIVLRTLTQQKWLEAASRLPEGAPGMGTLLSLLSGLDDVGSFVFGRNLQQFDCSNVMNALGGSGINCPPIDSEFIRVFRTALTGQQ